MQRRKTLLVEIQRRKKVGGILDRRFGENDPTMTPEEKALERFVKEKQRGSKKGFLFDLEDAEEDGQLTHFGKTLSFDKPDRADDFNEVDIEGSDSDGPDDFLKERPHKRRRLSDTDATSEESTTEPNSRPARPKSKKEVMEEVIAKSKLHKYERQQAKEHDDDLRAELDRGLPDLYALMRGPPPQAPPPPVPNTGIAGMNPDRLALLNGKERTQADREYDERLSQMALDQRAKPTERTLTREEKLLQEAQKLKELEEKRLRRMRGEPEDSDSDVPEQVHTLNGDDDPDRDEADIFGLGSGLTGERKSRQLDVEDEDEFLIEEDLIASGSELEASEVDESDNQSSEFTEEDDPEFVQGLLSREDIGREGLNLSKGGDGVSKGDVAAGGLAYTYKCPESHSDLLEMMRTVSLEDLPTVVRRIRALYHPRLASDNKEKLGRFATILVEHISYLACQPEHPPFQVLEALIRHIHSLAKTFPVEIGQAFRSHLKALNEHRPTSPTPGDLIILTAIASVFPTSDHFHQITTPAMLCMAEYLEQKIPRTLGDLAIGTYLLTLCLQYQRLSKRYVPEALNYTLNALLALSPIKPRKETGSFPHHSLPESIRLQDSQTPASECERLNFWAISPREDDITNQALKISLVCSHLALINNMIDLWAEKPAFCESFDPIYSVLRFLSGKSCSGKLNAAIQNSISTTLNKLHRGLRQSLAARKPLLLHNHRPLAIKTSIPKFEESYNPDKHYDPDRDRADMSKLKAEHKRERKGALRELRKDANFVARETLREKKERDVAYEKKYKRLVAEIQGEEGREAKNYEREKRMRKSRK